MASREDFGSWLEGVPTGAGAADRLGLPESGPGSRATLGPRLGALVVDWAAATLVAYLLLGVVSQGLGFWEGLSEVSASAQLGIFAVTTWLLVASIGSTIGHRIFGLRVVRLVDRRRPVGLGRSAIRTILLCLVIPAVVWDADGRGLHDKAAGTVLVRTR
ncbi:RDD family protein [Paraoerskovia marina]|uniref:RDD family protein n=1 Tax=Paraoerskovia marina TaxID=545619 RepID=A0A1H1S3S8_9CELL|nr:RDD family protein [Paraoerskovia marina]SDS42438.1 RDD family protein [Paraoerskovia marina]